MANLSNINNILRTDSLGVGINRDPLGVLEVSSATRSGIKMFNTGASGRTYETYVDASGNYIIYDEDSSRNDLVISSAGNATFAGSVSINSNAVLYLNNADNTNGFQIFNSGATGAYNANLIFLSGAVGERMRIDSSGLINFSKTATTATAVASINHASNNFLYINGGTEGASFGDKNQTTRVICYNNDYIRFDAAGSQRMRITSGGNVGIGTTNPGADLHVNSVNAQGTLIIGRTGSNLAVSTGLGVITFPADYNSSPTDYAQIRAYSNALSALRGSLDFNVKSTSGILLTGMSIYGTSAGVNVGIGTISPNQQLELMGNNAYTSKTRFSYGVGATNYFADWGYNSGGNKVYLTITDGGVAKDVIVANYTGNVGIGDTSPQGKLEVNNRNTATGAALFIKGGEDDLSPIAGQYTGLAFGYGGGDIYNNASILWEFTNTAANGKLHFAVNPTAGDGTANLSDSKMTIQDNGYVGIGTTSPSFQLSIENHATTTSVATLEIDGKRTDGNDGAVGELIFSNNGDTFATVVGFRDGADNSGSIVFQTQDSGTFGTRMTISSDGNVGIGVSNPETSRLLVRGSTNDSTSQIFQAANLGGATKYAIRADGDNKWYKSDNSLSMVLTSDGNVGIGTTGPSAKLDIGGNTVGSVQAIFGRGNSDSNFTVRYTNGITGTNNTVQGTIGLDYANGYWADMAAVKFIRDSTAGELAFYTSATATSGVERMRIDSSGNVGIGVTSLSKKLDVYQSNSSFSVADFRHINGNRILINPSYNYYDAYNHIFRGLNGTNTHMTIDNSGNVNINTGYLRVAGGSDQGTQLSLWADSGGDTHIAGYQIGFNTGLNSARTERMLVNSVGNVQILGIGNKNKGNLQLGPKTTGSKWSVLTGSHYNATSGSGNGSGSAGVMMIGVNAENGENHLVIGGAIYEANAATDIQFWTHTTDTSTAGGSEKMRITSGGNILAGKTATGQVLTNGFEISPDNYLSICNSVSANYSLYVANKGTSGTRNMVAFYGTSSLVGSITYNGTATAYNTTSDYRLKEDLKDFNGLDKVSKISVYDFKWKSEESRSYGVMAHELQEVLPDAVSGEKDAEENQMVDYSKIVPLLVKSIQELKAEIEILKNK